MSNSAMKLSGLIDLAGNQIPSVHQSSDEVLSLGTKSKIDEIVAKAAAKKAADEAEAAAKKAAAEAAAAIKAAAEAKAAQKTGLNYLNERPAHRLGRFLKNAPANETARQEVLAMFKRIGVVVADVSHCATVEQLNAELCRVETDPNQLEYVTPEDAKLINALPATSSNKTAHHKKQVSVESGGWGINDRLSTLMWNLCGDKDHGGSIIETITSTGTRRGVVGYRLMTPERLNEFGQNVNTFDDAFESKTHGRAQRQKMADYIAHRAKDAKAAKDEKERQKNEKLAKKSETEIVAKQNDSLTYDMLYEDESESTN